MPEVLIEAENIGKKFCRSLKRSLWYGVQDILGDLNPLTRRAGDDTATPALREHEFWALQDVSFQLRRGECLGLIGHNGAGKSTLLKILNGLIRPDTGRLVTRGRIGALIELSAGFNPILTGRENIYNRGAVLGFSREEIAGKFDAIVDFAEIGDFIDMPVRNYSSGMAMRLGFAVSSQMEPDILILDEVLAVGDVQFRHKCLREISRIRKEAAVLFVSHSMPQIFRICSKGILMNRGSITLESSDVGKVVTEYLRNIRPNHRISAGDDLFALHSAEARSAEGEASSDESETAVHRIGGSMAIDLDVESLNGIQTAAIKLSVWNQEMIPVMDVIDRNLTNFLVDFAHGARQRISIRIDNLRLNQGRYTVHLVVTDSAFDQIYSRFENILSFQVESPYPTGANHVYSGEMSVAPAVVAQV